MSDDLVNLIQREVERAMAGRHSKRYGLVTSYDASKHLAKVTMQPEGQESGWLPIRTSHIGNGWGMAVGLTEGDQVELTPQEGDVEALAITGVVHSEQDSPPVVQSGEVLIKHKDGASIKFAANGSTTLTDKSGASLTMDGTGTVTMASTTLKLNGAVDING
jgi:phage baseplate assembly protein V